MLEYKNVSIPLSEDHSSEPLTLVMRPGLTVCLQGKAGVGKSQLLLATLGLHPISQGFITFDGELVTVDSAPYFRNTMAYVPQDLPRGKMKTIELLDETTCLKESGRLDRKGIVEEARQYGIGPDVWNAATSELDDETLQIILLLVAKSLGRKVILVDNIFASETISGIIAQLAEQGAEVLYTCRTNHLACDKIVNL